MSHEISRYTGRIRVRCTLMCTSMTRTSADCPRGARLRCWCGGRRRNIRKEDKIFKMKVLTVKQPWAELICLGIKDVENRSWRCPKKFIGERVLIHAAKKNYDGPLDFDQIKAIDGFIYKKNVSREKVSILNPPEMWNTSAIIGSVKIVDCVTNHQRIYLSNYSCGFHSVFLL